MVSSRVALPTGGGVPLEEAALLGCAALTGVGAALFAARAEPGGSMLVVGAGGVGQFVVQGARIAGARRSSSSTPSGRARAGTPARRDLRAPPDGFAEALKRDHAGGSRLRLRCGRDPETSSTAMRFTRSGGRRYSWGSPAGRRLDLDPGEVLRREKWLTGTMYGSEDPAVALPILLEHVAAGRLVLAPLLGETFPLERIDEAVQASLALPAGRVLVEPWGRV